MIVIRIEESRLEEAIRKALREYQIAVIPVIPPDTYYVADELVAVLEREEIPFEKVLNGKIVQFAERMLSDIHQAFEDIRQGRVAPPEASLPIKQRIETALRNGQTPKRG